MVNRSRPALRPKRNAITCTRQPRFLIPVFAWLLSFSFSVGLLLPSPQAVWAQAYTVIPYEDEVNLDRLQDLSENPKTKDLFLPQSKEPCPSSVAALWLRDAQDSLASRVAAAVWSECVPKGELSRENAFAVLKYGALALTVAAGEPVYMKPAAGAVLADEFRDSAAQCVLTVIGAVSDMSPAEKRNYNLSVQAVFAYKDLYDLGQFIRKAPGLSDANRLKKLKNAFDGAAALADNIGSTGNEGPWTEALKMAQEPADEESEMGLFGSPEKELESAKTLADRCEFVLADAARRRATDWQKKAIHSAFLRYRKNEWSLYCFRQLTKRRLSDDTPSYGISSAVVQQSGYSGKRQRLSKAELALRESVGFLDRTDAMEKIIDEANAALEVKRRSYRRLLTEGNAALGAHDLRDACTYVKSLQDELQPLSPTCRAALLGPPGSLRSPAAFIADLGNAFEDEKGRILGLLGGADRSLVACRPEDARTALQAFPNELKKLVAYLPRGSDDGVPDATLGPEGTCVVPAQPSIDSSLRDYLKWLDDIEKSAKEAKEGLANAESDAKDLCRCEDALNNQGGENRLTSRIRQGCVKGGDERLVRIKTNMAQRSTAASQGLETVESAPKKVADLIDQKPEPAHCAVDDAARLVDEALEAAKKLRCPPDDVSPPSVAASARWKRAEPKIQELESSKKAVEDLEQKINTVVAGLTEAAGKVKAEPDCLKAAELLDRQKVASQEILKCREYSSTITDSLASIAKLIDTRRTEASRKAIATAEQGKASLGRCDDSLRRSLTTIDDLRAGPAKSCVDAASATDLDTVADDLGKRIAELKTCQAKVEQALAAIEANLKVCKLDGIEKLVQQASDVMPKPPCPVNHPQFVEYARRIADIGSRIGTLKADIELRRAGTLLSLRTAQAYLDNWNRQVKWDESRKAAYKSSIEDFRLVLFELEANPTLGGCLKDLVEKMRGILAQAVPPPSGEAQSASADHKAELAALDCPNRFPGSVAVWSEKEQRAGCVCPDPPGWNADKTACNVDRAAALAAMDCPKLFPGSSTVWSETEQRAGCVCPDPPGWNTDKTACNVDRAAALAALDCDSKYPGSVAFWSEVKQRAGCVCPDPPGWNTDKTACNKPGAKVVEALDCGSKYPGSVVVWDEGKQMQVCRCVPPKKWNAAHTVCIGVSITTKQDPITPPVIPWIVFPPPPEPPVTPPPPTKTGPSPPPQPTKVTPTSPPPVVRTPTPSKPVPAQPPQQPWTRDCLEEQGSWDDGKFSSIHSTGLRMCPIKEVSCGPVPKETVYKTWDRCLKRQRCWLSGKCY
jgi:hypothetical protein